MIVIGLIGLVGFAATWTACKKFNIFSFNDSKWSVFIKIFGLSFLSTFFAAMMGAAFPVAALILMLSLKVSGWVRRYTKEGTLLRKVVEAPSKAIDYIGKCFWDGVKAVSSWFGFGKETAAA